MSEHFNELSPTQLEVLAITSEECAEVGLIIGKIIRHGLDSHHPDDKTETQNWVLLQRELGDVLACMRMLDDLGIVALSEIGFRSKEKLEKVQQYLHHYNTKSCVMPLSLLDPRYVRRTHFAIAHIENVLKALEEGDLEEAKLYAKRARKLLADDDVDTSE